MAPFRSSDTLRWPLADDDESDALVPDERRATRHLGTGEYRGLEFLHVNAKRIINSVPGGDSLGFRFTINPYRGCSHACTYCFARPTHEYLGLGMGRDFEQKIVVKINAVERLRAELAAATWQGDLIAMGTNTDPYQAAEGKYHLTRGIIEVLSQTATPFSILTKSTLVLRDLELLVEATRRTSVRLDLSIGTLDRAVWRATEPGTPPPDRRVEAVRRLNEAGVPCGVLVAPILPGLSDREEQITEVIEACVSAGATSVTAVPLHLRNGVKEHYLSWLASARPDLVARHERLFSEGAYQPKAERARLARLVSALVPTSRNEPARSIGRGSRQVVEPTERKAGAPGGVAVQLRLA
ncbi:MAG: radical SAM protein [Acidimicrobiales bacterium]